MDLTAERGDAERRTMLFVMSVPAGVLDGLRTRFPAVRFRTTEASADDADKFITDRPPTAAELGEVDAVIGWELDSALLAAAPRLRWVHAASAGIDHFDLPALAAHGVTMTNSRGVHAQNIAEHVLGMMIALARRFPRLIQAQSAREWRDSETHREVRELHGQTVLLVGLGEIGREVARRAAAFGMRVEAVRRIVANDLPPGVARQFTLEALDEALPGADHVVLTLPDTPATRGLFDAARFARMKPGAMIYNVGRGPVIDTTALIAALTTGTLGGAGLDVTHPEPLPVDSPLWTLDNVFITAHTAGATPRYWERLEPLIADNIDRWLRGEPLRNVVDLAAGY